MLPRSASFEPTKPLGCSNTRVLKYCDHSYNPDNTGGHPLNSYKDDCVFCRELAGKTNTNFARLYPDLAGGGRFIASNERFVAFPCIGQLAPMHSLIIPRTHVSTMREACSQGDDWVTSFTDVLHKLNRHYGISDEVILYFEHGVREPSGGGCGIYHAHLHVLPQAGHIQPHQLGDVSHAVHFDSLLDALSTGENLGDYVLTGSRKNYFAVEERADPLPSQTLRKRVADALGYVGNWDWRASGRESSLLDALGVQA
ncbi:HIT domain-containing protein [Burkholderia sp. 4701]|nr:HIT domain-containing protein [Burkholderia sp. 4701]MXN82675.1 HIT domain-containing protein [Burkholderia sp. 4812]